MWNLHCEVCGPLCNLEVAVSNNGGCSNHLSPSPPGLTGGEGDVAVVPVVTGTDWSHVTAGDTACWAPIGCANGPPAHSAAL